MSLFKSRGSDRTPVQVDDTAPAEVAAIRESVLLDMVDRRNNAIVEIEAALRGERGVLSRPVRDLLLDVHLALVASDPVQLRPAVPVIPGRAS